MWPHQTSSHRQVTQTGDLTGPPPTDRWPRQVTLPDLLPQTGDLTGPSPTDRWPRQVTLPDLLPQTGDLTGPPPTDRWPYRTLLPQTDDLTGPPPTDRWPYRTSSHRQVTSPDLLPQTDDLTGPPPTDRWPCDLVMAGTGDAWWRVNLAPWVCGWWSHPPPPPPPSSYISRSGVVDPSGGPAHPHHRAVHLHHRPEVRGRALAGQRHLDTGYPSGAAQRLRPLRLPDQHQTATHHHRQFHRYWWVPSANISVIGGLS